MLAWIFSDDAYTELYHQLYSEFLAETMENGACEALIYKTANLIAPYVAEDPTKFCSYEEFQSGVEALQTFCQLRTRSVRGQLEGTIPSTTAEQPADRSALVDCSALDLTDMGSMGMGGGMGGPGGGGFDPGQRPDGEMPQMPDNESIPVFVPGQTDGEPPENSGEPPFGDHQENGRHFQGGEPGAPTLTVADSVLPLGISVTALAAGLVFAKIFRRRR